MDASPVLRSPDLEEQSPGEPMPNSVLHERDGQTPQDTDDSSCKKRHVWERAPKPAVCPQAGAIQLEKRLRLIRVLSRKRHVRPSGLAPLAQVLPGANDVLLPADSPRIEDDSVSEPLETIAKIDVLVPESSSLREIRVKAAAGLKSLARQGELPG